jgi:cytochrome c553
MCRALFLLLALCVLVSLSAVALAADAKKGANPEAIFIGSAACKQCHEQEYDNFAKYSKKPHSKQSVEKMRPKLTREEQESCYPCHTTGYGQKSGFVSYEKTPHLGDVGCETCHGPGSEHAETGETTAITRKPTVETCLVCHNAERIQNFNFRPLRYSGAH